MNIIKSITLLTLILTLSIFNGCATGDSNFKVISEQELKDKIAGGWAGKMIGVMYGEESEFKARSVIYEKDLPWEPEMIKGALGQDDLYVQMSFMMTMDQHGMNAPAEKFAESFANAGYRLWHANRKARKNYWDGIMPPMSGSPKYSMHADDIDFQIEADYIGFMCPGMPQTSNKMCDKIGHIMNYGDGVFGGMFVCALYTSAYFEKDIHKILESALQAIPAKSQYAQCVRDVIAGYERNPDDWRKTWQELEDKWGSVDICGAMDPFNIDAKINGAYIVMGLLYGEGDFHKTMEVSTRCGQDSDCNPSNAAGVLGIMSGISSIDDKWKSGIPAMADSVFIYTNYTFNLVVKNTLEYAKKLIVENGGKIEGDKLYIKIQQPVAPPLEQSFSDIKVSYRTSNEDENWKWKGKWEEYKYPYSGGMEFKGKVSTKDGSECIISFNGTGFLLMGHWNQDGGKADVYLDGKKVQTIDTYYWVRERGAGAGWLNGAHLYHVLGLEPGDHTVRVVATGDKNDKATGTKIYLERAIVYQPK
jgi:hypothetical protein